jgi:large subunit ribosomal protein L9
MKVILIKDVARIGRRGEIKEVPSGHALNFLIPRKMAEPATPFNLKRLTEMKSKQAEGVLHTEESFENALKTLETTQVELAAPANEQGHLFKGIKAVDISGRLTELGIPIAVECIDLPHPLKSLGTHEVPLLSGKKHGVLTLSIIQK